MSNRSLIVALVSGFLSFASQAQAGVLTSATWNGSFQGYPLTLTLTDRVIGGIAAGVPGLVASGNATGTGAYVAVSVIQFTTSVPSLPPPPHTLSISQMLGGNQVINIAGLVASATGTPNMGAVGTVNVFALGGVPLLLLRIPLNVGGTGTATGQFFNPNIGHASVTATFLGWQIAPFAVTGLTNQGIALPDAMFTGTNMLVGGVGTVTLVAPARVEICAGGGTTTAGTCTGASHFNRTASAMTLKLTFVPEPGVLLLLGAGLAGLALVGRRNLP